MEPEHHSIGKSIVLHLLPGLAGTLFYMAVAPALITNGYPAILGLLVAATLVILPLELGYLLFQAKKYSGTFSLRRIVLFRKPLPR